MQYVYEGKMGCAIDENSFIEATGLFFKSTNFIAIMYNIVEYLNIQCTTAVAGVRLIPNYLAFIQKVITLLHDSYLITQNQLEPVSAVQIIGMFCNKIGDTIISEYKANQNANTLKNFEELLKVHNLLILYCGDKFGQLSGFAISGFIQGFTDQEQTCFKLQVQYLLSILFEDSILRAVFVTD